MTPRTMLDLLPGTAVSAPWKHGGSKRARITAKAVEE